MAEEKKEIAVVEEKKVSFSEQLTTSLSEVKTGLPMNFNIQRFVNNAVALCNDNEIISSFAKQYGMAQVKAGLLKGAYLGLDAMNAEFYLVPFGSKLNFMTSYKGKNKIVKKYSIRPVKDIFAEIVRQGDEFKTWSDDEGQHFEFMPLPFNAGSIIGAFAVVKFVDGGVLVDTMSIGELENTRKHSKASNSMAWKDFTSEMYKKTVLHRICKHVEIDFENPTQRTLYDEDMAVETDTSANIGEIPDIAEENIIDVESVEECAN